MTRLVTTRSLFALTAALSLTAATAVAQDAAPQPTPTQTEQAAPAKTAWEDLDVNKDGNLSKEETAPSPGLQQVFEKADSNADGALTGDEYRSYLAMNKSDGSKPKKDRKN